MKNRPVDILYVEDDVMDVDLAKTALSMVCHDTEYKMEVVDDGEKALEFLNREGEYRDSRQPDVILLDLNLPKVHGLEVLRRVKESDHLRKIPVVILSTSSMQHDVDETYRLGACGYLTKPGQLKDYQETFKAVCSYWFHKINFPTKNA